MKRILLTCVLALMAMPCFAQIEFEAGYFIDNNGKKIEALIKNIDWKNNPRSFEYRLAADTEKSVARIDSVMEFGVGEKKYIRSLVKIDRSTQKINDLGMDKNPEFKEETLFLESILEGTATLYSYQEGALIRYFYKVSNSDIQQLIYKKYRAADGGIGTNDKYKQQLWLDLSCVDINAADPDRTSYQKSALTKYFIKYNTCVNPDFAVTDKSTSKDKFNLTIRPGLSNSTLLLSSGEAGSEKKLDFGSKVNYRIGIEAEYILPYNKNKWALVFEPTYHQFKSEAVGTHKFYNLYYSIDYKAIELPIGIRYYSFITKSSKVFLTAAAGKDFSLTPTVKNGDRDFLKIWPRYHANVSLGYKFKNKLSVDLKYGFNRNILTDYLGWGAKFNTSSIILGYTIF